MTLPISVVVIYPSGNEQKAIMAAARDIDAFGSRVAFEDSSKGLIVHGLTELDIEMAVYELQKSFPSIRSGKPQVAYHMGPPMLEPYYRATIDAPSENLGWVLGDISSRRGEIQSVQEGATETQVVADMPVSECFGYSATLRALTRGRGRYSVEYLGYRPTPYLGPGTDDAA